MNENFKKFVSISGWLTAILLLVRFLISWADVKDMWEGGNVLNLGYNFFGFIGEVIGVVTIVMAIFNKWAWKWKWLSWTHNVPVLAKKYNSTFVSDYDGMEYSGRIAIDQTFLNVTIQFKTDESISRSLIASFSELQCAQHLIYTYQNDPRAEIQDRSPMHYGTAILNVSDPMILEGNYFTSRKSRGSMKLEAVK